MLDKLKASRERYKKKFNRGISVFKNSDFSVNLHRGSYAIGCDLDCKFFSL